VGSQDLQTNRYDQLIRRVGGLYGGGSKVVEALPELFPIIELEQTTPELLALSGWRTAWQSTERLSGVGNESTSQLFNPPGSGQIIAVTSLGVRSNFGSTISVEISAMALAAGVRGLFRDGRFGVPRNTTAIVSSLDGGTTGGGLRLTIVADEQLWIRDDNGIVVLTPGTGLNVGTNSTNVLLTVNYLWRERLALESEINFP